MKAIWYRRDRLRARSAAYVACAAIGLVIPACADDSAESVGPTVTQRITRDFGRELLSSQDAAPLEGHRTAMRLLKGYNDVETIVGGRFVDSIDGLRSDRDPPDETTWALIVNGVEADELAPDYRLYAGDVVQWDLRDWYVTLDVRATVGAFPQTFTRGVFGKRFPVAVRCEHPVSAPCRRVKAALTNAGVAVDGSRPTSARPGRGEPQRATVLVGAWDHWRDRAWAGRIDQGPRYSGVFARFAPDGTALHLLDWNAQRVRTVGAGAGLVAAMRPTDQALIWVVTGVDRKGVERAAAALNTDDLRDAFAVAVTADGIEKLPLGPR